MANELVSLGDKWAVQAAAAVAEEPNKQSGLWLSARGGVLAFDGAEMPGNQAAVVVLDSLRENTFYESKFDPGAQQPPTCYAFGRGPEEMAPHASMQRDPVWFKPQSDTCDTCPQNAWGSADKGQGKACGNRRRLTLLPAGFYTPRKGSRDFDLDLFEDPSHFAAADAAFFKLPVTSTKHWSKYVTQVAATMRRPPHGVITRLYLEQHANDQFHVKFEVIGEVSDDLAEIVMARQEAVVAAPPEGYAPPKATDDTPSLRRGR